MRRLILLFLMVGAFTAVAALILLKPAAEVRGKTTAVPIAAQMTPEQQTAQDLALADARVQAFTSGHRAEVFGVSRVVLGPYPESLAACAASDCRQVEIYLWDTDTAVTAFVRLDTAEVLDVMRQPHLRPGINKRLHDLSLEIATNAPEVIAALGFKPAGGKVLAAVDAGLLDTACGGEHLCVAPTFAAGDGRILWAVVDLTAEELAGIYWTEAPPVGEFEPFVPTDCGVAQSVSRDGWSLSYVTTNNDGLNVYNVNYNGTPVITSIKLVEWHADYGSSGYQDSTGCSSGGGGFTIYPYGATQVLDLLDEQSNVIGFEVVQDFRMGNWGNTCNYRYEQRIRFYADGSFRPVSAAYGKGCGTNSLYRPVLRINIAVDGDENDLFSRWDGTAWQAMTTEDYLVPYTETGHGPHHIDGNGYSWKVEDTVSGMGYYIVQDVGQFPNGEGDNPFLYPVLHHANEGDTDLYVFSSGCCNDNHQQGPHLYLNGESINSENIVLWYVPQADTDATAPDYYCWTISGEPNPETYPCFIGPLFVPMMTTPIADFTHNGPLVLGNTAVFTNTSTGDPITYTWDFGDGSPLSNLENPMHDYASVGDYTVTLTATNNAGSDVATDMLRVGLAPTAVFTHPTSASAQSPVQFTNQSQGTPELSYDWDFGDGSARSTAVNPIHVYTISGTYTITLTVNSPFGTDSASSVIVIDGKPVAPTAAFTATLPALVNQPVSFTNLTAGTPPISYTWDFGDGSPMVSEVSPTHTFTATGSYTVTLTAVNAVGSDSVTAVIEVIALDNFIYLPAIFREE
ncbi:MAG TPA: PKD domain-containing protein [Chloroflexota bacterium]|nr:PKD domain-containing protein [Chloroflexota bacterium]